MVTAGPPRGGDPTEGVSAEELERSQARRSGSSGKRVSTWLRQRNDDFLVAVGELQPKGVRLWGESRGQRMCRAMTSRLLVMMLPQT